VQVGVQEDKGKAKAEPETVTSAEGKQVKVWPKVERQKVVPSFEDIILYFTDFH
jgi:pyruvate kinase